MFISPSLFKLLAANGAVLENGVAVNYTRGYGIIIREDTVIANWTDSVGNNMLTAFNIAGVTLHVTDIGLMIPENRFIRSIQLTSGSIWILLP
jgi:hypothetical protein